jgi:hypothetical protein
VATSGRVSSKELYVILMGQLFVCCALEKWTKIKNYNTFCLLRLRDHKRRYSIGAWLCVGYDLRPVAEQFSASLKLEDHRCVYQKSNILRSWHKNILLSKAREMEPERRRGQISPN